jgi:hypothetical protein
MLGLLLRSIRKAGSPFPLRGPAFPSARWSLAGTSDAAAHSARSHRQLTAFRVLPASGLSARVRAARLDGRASGRKPDGTHRPAALSGSLADFHAGNVPCIPAKPFSVHSVSWWLGAPLVGSGNRRPGGLLEVPMDAVGEDLKPAPRKRLGHLRTGLRRVPVVPAVLEPL